MKIKQRSYPHPVLSPITDDVLPNTFDVSLSARSDPLEYRVEVAMVVTNRTICDLIAERKAYYTVHVECRNNYYRRAFPQSESSAVVVIGSDELEGVVEVSSFIIAADAISDYLPEGAHEDYAGSRFLIRPGDIIAVGPSLEFLADKEYDALKPISSIMRILPSDKITEGLFKAAFEDERINIFLNNVDYERFGSLKASKVTNASLIQGISVPVLAEAIRELRGTPEADRSYRWQNRIKLSLDAIDPAWEAAERSPLELAQQLLTRPFGRFLSELGQLADKS